MNTINCISNIAKRILFLLYILASVFSITNGTPLRSRPVVGILSQPYHDDNDYVAASYIKWLESAGARSIVIPYEADDELLEEIFTQINGMFFPGGDSSLPPHAKKMWNLITERNANEGDFFPVWGTCLGFEFILMLAGGEDVLEVGVFDAENVTYPLIFPTDEDVLDSGGVFSIQSELYPASSAMRETLAKSSITMNNHYNGISPSNFIQSANLTQLFHITSTNMDKRGKPFVSTIESKLYPIYGTQYHPEKNNFEFGLRQSDPWSKYYSDEPYEAINHSEEAVELSMKLAFFFVGKLRRSSHGTYNMVQRHPNIYQYPIERGKKFEQVFLIPKAKEWKLKHNNNDQKSNNHHRYDHYLIGHWVLSFILLCAMGFFAMFRTQNFGSRYKYLNKDYFHIPDHNPGVCEMMVE